MYQETGQPGLHLAKVTDDNSYLWCARLVYNSSDKSFVELLFTG